MIGRKKPLHVRCQGRPIKFYAVTARSLSLRFVNVFGRYTAIRSGDADQRGGICRFGGQQYAVQCNAK
jgi:hypothetical protein